MRWNVKRHGVGRGEDTPQGQHQFSVHKIPHSKIHAKVMVAGPVAHETPAT